MKKEKKYEEKNVLGTVSIHVFCYFTWKQNSYFRQRQIVESTAEILPHVTEK